MLRVIPNYPYRLDHDRLIKLATMAGFSKPETLDFEVAWFRARSLSGNYVDALHAMWEAIGWLPASKQKHAHRKIVDAYVRSIKSRKKG